MLVRADPSEIATPRGGGCGVLKLITTPLTYLGLRVDAAVSVGRGEQALQLRP